MNASTIAPFLKDRVGPFREISRERLELLVEGSRVASFEAGAAIMRQGEEAAHFGVVLSGTVEVSAMTEGGKPQRLGRLEPGETFNELALLTGDAVLADFVAASPCEVLLIPVSL